MIDVVGSSIGLILSAPIFLVIAGLVKLTSDGPVFFRQQRIGQHGTPFTFLKFRTMFTNNDHSVHKEFVQQLIAGKVKPNSNGNGNGNGNGHGVYKIKSDPRITRIGSFLRRSSLDELPQLINVLRGEMSLVGPRPPVKYEVDAYEIWHRGRLMEAKPGITGLWQVNGRSRVKFDEMVRLDIRYARTWSLWLDIKILIRTPHAVLLGEGAY
jgi:lipopolysaccharide/colanic/teichoic acid biosynthesis glycosyltransferase